MSDTTTQIISLNAIHSATHKQIYACLIVISGSNAGQMFRLQDKEISIGRSTDNTIPILEDGISRTHCRLYCLGEDQVMLEDLNSTNGTFVNGTRIARYLLTDGDKIQIGSSSIIKFTYHDKIEEEFQKQMFESALRDGLTQAYNKRYFIERLHAEYSYSLRHNIPLSMIMIDLDHFKEVNDTHGHLAGDTVLVELTQRMHSAIRSEDVFARYGGEEFALIARGISHSNGLLLAERLRHLVCKTPIKYKGLHIKMTASFGLCAIPYHQVGSTTEMIEIADKGLYRAKESGRNCVATL